MSTTTPQNSENISQDDGLKILVGAINQAQAKGKYSLEEAVVLSKAVNVFVQVPDGQEKPKLPESLNQQDALKVIVSAIQQAQSRGKFSVEEAEIMAKAVSNFQVTKEEYEQMVAEANNQNSQTLETIAEEVSADDNTIIV
jgi:20S proteasome alpha/beta subunit